MSVLADTDVKRTSRRMIPHTSTLAWFCFLNLTIAAPDDSMPAATEGGADSQAASTITTAAPNDPAMGIVVDQSPSGGADVVIPIDRLKWHIPDPESERPLALEAMARAQKEGDKTLAGQIARVLERVDMIRRPQQQLHLTLQEALRRALESNYAIEILRYNPAIETTRVVEAQAAFDAVFFTNIIKNNIDRPSGSQLTATDVDLFSSSYGIRKVLPTGMSVSGAYELNRTKTGLSFQQINPEYTSNFVFEMRQPMLRGFGIDYNRSLILLTKNDRRIADETFRRQVRDTLRQVEELYWRLVQARRDVVITARLLAEYETIYEYLVARQKFDITPVQIAATKANLEESRFDFVRRRAFLFDAEDRLVAAMNSDDVDLADDIEIIPDDFPQIQRIVVDRLAEVQTALDHRQEIKEQELRVDSAKIAVGQAKNGELPRFDLTFSQKYDGLGGSADRSFDELTRGNFIEYFIGVEFEAPIGNRGPRAAHHRSRLVYSQAVATLKRVFEEVILDVNLATRAMSTAYDQIGPTFEAAEARVREVDSIVARAERKDINTLNSELGSRQSLATARRLLIASMVEYNIAIIDLERAKGTLLAHNNVMIPSDPD